MHGVGLIITTKAIATQTNVHSFIHIHIHNQIYTLHTQALFRDN